MTYYSLLAHANSGGVSGRKEKKEGEIDDTQKQIIGPTLLAY